MKTLIIGLGVQGVKRLKVAGSDVVATVDNYKSDADFKTLEEVPIHLYDAAILCTPDEPKFDVYSIDGDTETKLTGWNMISQDDINNWVKILTVADKHITRVLKSFGITYRPN